MVGAGKGQPGQCRCPEGTYLGDANQCVSTCPPGTTPAENNIVGRFCQQPFLTPDVGGPAPASTPVQAIATCEIGKVAVPGIGCVTKTQRNIGIAVALVGLYLLLK